MDSPLLDEWSKNPFLDAYWSRLVVASGMHDVVANPGTRDLQTCRPAELVLLRVCSCVPEMLINSTFRFDLIELAHERAVETKTR